MIMNKLLLTAAAALILSGCGADRKETDRTRETRTYSVQGKEYVVPAHPVRIAADYYTGELLKLGAPLVGADLTYTSSAWEDLLEGLADTGQSLESLMALQPDLIITINSERVEQYSSIAPTVLIPYGLYNPEELIMELSILTSTEESAETWVNEFNGSIETLKSLIPDNGESYTIIDAWGGSAYLYGEHYGRGGYILYNKLGLSGTPDAENEYIRRADSYMNLTVEALPRFAGDVILLMSAGAEEGDSSFFTENIIWESLPAVQEGNVIRLDSQDFQFSDPFSLDLQVEILERFFRDRQ